MTESVHHHLRVKTVGLSMVPFVLPGSILIVEPIEHNGAVPVGSILCFLDEDAQGVAHRLIRKETNVQGVQYWVRGDAQVVEEMVPEGSVVYRVCRVEHRLLSYDIDGILGRGFAAFSTADSLYVRWFRKRLVKGCFVAIRLRQRRRHLHDRKNG